MARNSGRDMGREYALRGTDEIRGDKKNWKNAEKYFTAAINAGYETHNVFESRSLVYAKLGRHYESLDDAIEAIRLKSTSEEAWARLASQLGALGLWELSVQTCNLALQKCPDGKHVITMALQAAHRGLANTRAKKIQVTHARKYEQEELATAKGLESGNLWLVLEISLAEIQKCLDKTDPAALENFLVTRKGMGRMVAALATISKETNSGYLPRDSLIFENALKTYKIMVDCTLTCMKRAVDAFLSAPEFLVLLGNAAAEGMVHHNHQKHEKGKKTVHFGRLLMWQMMLFGQLCNHSHKAREWSVTQPKVLGLLLAMSDPMISKMWRGPCPNPAMEEHALSCIGCLLSTSPHEVRVKARTTLISMGGAELMADLLISHADAPFEAGSSEEMRSAAPGLAVGLGRRRFNLLEFLLKHAAIMAEDDYGRRFMLARGLSSRLPQWRVMWSKHLSEYVKAYGDRLILLLTGEIVPGPSGAQASHLYPSTPRGPRPDAANGLQPSGSRNGRDPSPNRMHSGPPTMGGSRVSNVPSTPRSSTPTHRTQPVAATPRASTPTDRGRPAAPDKVSATFNKVMGYVRGTNTNNMRITQNDKSGDIGSSGESSYVRGPTPERTRIRETPRGYSSETPRSSSSSRGVETPRAGTRVGLNPVQEGTPRRSSSGRSSSPFTSDKDGDLDGRRTPRGSSRSGPMAPETPRGGRAYSSDKEGEVSSSRRNALEGNGGVVPSTPRGSGPSPMRHRSLDRPGPGPGPGPETPRAGGIRAETPRAGGMRGETPRAGATHAPRVSFGETSVVFLEKEESPKAVEETYRVQPQAVESSRSGFFRGGAASSALGRLFGKKTHEDAPNNKKDASRTSYFAPVANNLPGTANGGGLQRHNSVGANAPKVSSSFAWIDNVPSTPAAGGGQRSSSRGKGGGAAGQWEPRSRTRTQ